MRILSFGHIPSWAGGRQESGLANVIYQLAKYMSQCDNTVVTLAATDVFVSSIMHDKLHVVGWNKGSLIAFALKHLLLSIRWMIQVIYYKIKFGSVVSVLGFFFKGLHLYKSIRLCNPEVVHLHGPNACIYDKIIPKNINVVVTMHGLIGLDKTIKNQSILYRMEKDICKSKRYSMIGFIAEKLIADFTELYGTINSPTKVLLNAYDAKSFYYIEPKQHNGLILATIASLSENKGQERVVEAISRSGIDCKYICVGGDSANYEKKIKDIALSLNVHWEYQGKKSPSEIREILSKVDYMILPSSTEGFGLVYLEAIACGVPVILPKHLPIVNEKGIIQMGINSLLLNDSSVDSIADLLPNLCNYQFNRKMIADSIVSYSWTNIAKEYVECFKKL